MYGTHVVFVMLEFFSGQPVSLHVCQDIFGEEVVSQSSREVIRIGSLYFDGLEEWIRQSGSDSFSFYKKIRVEGTGEHGLLCVAIVTDLRQCCF